MAQVGLYVQLKYSKKAYSKESYDIRYFPGVELVKFEIEKENIPVEYCSLATVQNYLIVLVSITSQCDWLSFVSERLRWTKGNYRIIVGGFGVLNYHPFKDLINYFYFGRAENDIGAMVKEIIENGECQDRGWVVDTKHIKNQYQIRQAALPYKETYILPNGQPYKESVIGCQRKCLFCSYTWHRKFTGGLQKNSGIFAGEKEKTIFEILAGDHNDLTKLRMIGLDGISQRLRYSMNKNISNEDIINFMQIMSSKAKPHTLKFYNICGYWNEKPDDYLDFAEAIKKIDHKIVNGKWNIVLHSTPFRPMPATPLSHMPTQYKNFRGQISKELRKHTGYISNNSVFFNGKNIMSVETMGTESLSTVIIDMIVLRGTESDGENFRRLAMTKKFHTSDSKTKVKTLEKHFDVQKLFGSYPIGELPTEYLKSYTKYKIKVA